MLAGTRGSRLSHIRHTLHFSVGKDQRKEKDTEGANVFNPMKSCHYFSEVLRVNLTSEVNGKWSKSKVNNVQNIIFCVKSQYLMK